jgi:hypothetical protein
MGLGLGRAGHRALGRAAVTGRFLARVAPSAFVTFVCLVGLTALQGCSSVGGISGAVAGIASGSAVGNPAVGVAVGIGVQAGVDASISAVLRHWSHEEQALIAAQVGAMPIGTRRPWEIRHALPYGNNQGEVTAVREYVTPLAICREAIFTVGTDARNDSPGPYFVTSVCRAAPGGTSGQAWKWATAEPSVERWGALQ